jgi:hypothetical protein
MFEDFSTASAFVREHQIRMIDLRSRPQPYEIQLYFYL